MISRLEFERWQVAVYAVAIGAGCVLGWSVPDTGPVMEQALWPVLALLLYVTFVQVPLDHLAEAVRDRRFLGALLVTNFLIVPALVWALARAGAIVEAFLGLIVAPLLLALATEWMAHRSAVVARWREASAWWPVPLLAVAVFLIAGAPGRVVADAAGQLGAATAVFIAYAGIIPFVARWVGRRYRLDELAQRTLVFSAGTRNSFVVLPFALALPAEWRLAVAVIVLQSLVELVAMIFYLWWVPQKLIRNEETIVFGSR